MLERPVRVGTPSLKPHLPRSEVGGCEQGCMGLIRSLQEAGHSSEGLPGLWLDGLALKQRAGSCAYSFIMGSLTLSSVPPSVHSELASCQPWGSSPLPGACKFSGGPGLGHHCKRVPCWVAPSTSHELLKMLFLSFFRFCSPGCVSGSCQGSKLSSRQCLVLSLPESLSSCHSVWVVGTGDQFLPITCVSAECGLLVPGSPSNRLVCCDCCRLPGHRALICNFFSLCAFVFEGSEETWNT